MFLNLLKWMLIWIANIIPWLSWWTMAVILWIYKELTKSISNIITDSKNRKKYFLFLSIIWIWALIWIFIFSYIFSALIDSYEIYTNIFIIWIILWSIPYLYKNIPNNKLSISKILVFLIWLFSVLLLFYFWNWDLYSNSDTNWIIYNIKLFFSWFVAAASMIIPWFSWSMMLLILGEYENILSFVKDFVFDKLFIIWFWAIIWIILSARVIYYILNSSFASHFYYIIIAMVLASSFTLIPFKNIYNIYVYIILIIIFIIWFSISFYFPKILLNIKNKKSQQ